MLTRIEGKLTRVAFRQCSQVIGMKAVAAAHHDNVDSLGLKRRQLGRYVSDDKRIDTVQIWETFLK